MANLLVTVLVFGSLLLLFAFLGRTIVGFFGALPESRSLKVGVSYLVGLTIFVLALEGIGLAGYFNSTAVTLVLLVILGIDLHTLFRYWRRTKGVAGLVRKVGLALIANKDWLIFPLIVLAGASFLVCFAPPTAWDEVAYHLPLANEILHHGITSFPIAGSKFYGSIPISMEVLFAFGLMLRGYPLAHLLHFSYLLALILVIIGFAKTRYSLRAGLIAAILTFFIPGFVDNATSCYVDAAEAVLEFTAIIMMVGWFERRSGSYPWLAGFFWGAAIGIKYSAFYGLLTAIGLAALVIIVSPRKATKKMLWSDVIHFVVMAVLIGGVWYIKNLILYKNPVYPLIFSHDGFSSAEINSLVAAIKSFSVARNLLNFIKIPIIFFQNEAGLYNLFILAFTLAPLAIIDHRKRNTVVYLGLLALVNLAVWFFVVSHQPRFIFSTFILIVLLASITISKIDLLSYKKILPMLSILLVTNLFFNYFPTTRFLSSFYYNNLKVKEVAYAIGRIDEPAYLRYKLGDFALVTDYINKHYQNTVSLNIWNHTASYYLTNGNSYNYDVAEDGDYEAFLDKNNITLLAIDERLRQKFIDKKNWGSYTDNGLALEQYFIARANLIMSNDNSQLYQLKY